LCSENNGRSFCEVGISADLFGAICIDFFLSLKFTFFNIILRSLVKYFLTKMKITTHDHKSAHKFKYGASTSYESGIATRAKRSAVIPTAQKDPPLSHKGVEMEMVNR